jgi:DUF971 family protein
MKQYTLKETSPSEVQFNSENLSIQWKDGALHHLNLLELRKLCPCATCRGGHGGSVGAATGHIQAIQLVSWTKVGRYALSLVWNDGHNSGIYSYDHLRALGEGDRHAFD